MPTRLALPAGLLLAAWLGISAALPAQTATPAPGPLAPFGVSEATVRTLLLDSVSGGGEVSARLRSVIQDGYDRMPPAARAAATTAAFAWAKGYLSSASFATVYAQYRDEHKPAGAGNTDSIDVEVQKQIAGMVAQLEESKKNLAFLDAATRAKVIKSTDDQIARYKDPEYARQLRVGLEIQRTAKTEGDAKKAEEFAAKWPADPKTYVKKQLERFMATTANIDYSLPQIWVKDPAGHTAGFLSPGLEDISWEAMYAILAGKDAVDAARIAVSAWLKELP
jgi:hypothetical protein